MLTTRRSADDESRFRRFADLEHDRRRRRFGHGDRQPAAVRLEAGELGTDARMCRRQAGDDKAALAPVTFVRDRPVAVLLTVTVTPGMTPPFGSLMVPLTVAGVCAETRAGTNSSEHASVQRSKHIFDSINALSSLSHEIASHAVPRARLQVPPDTATDMSLIAIGLVARHPLALPAAPGLLVLAHGASARVRVPAGRPGLSRRLLPGRRAPDVGADERRLAASSGSSSAKMRRTAGVDSCGHRLHLSRRRPLHRHLRVPHRSRGTRPRTTSWPAARSGPRCSCCRSSART